MKRDRPLDVVLGPWSGLHSGAHGALLAAPPAHVDYRLASCGRAFTFASPHSSAPSPLNAFAVDEAVWLDEPDDPDVVHLHHLPLAGTKPFVVDTDDLVATLTVGRFLPFRRFEGFRLSDLDADLVRRRQRTVLARFCSSQCIAILFWTDVALSRALRYVAAERLAGREDLAALEAKSVVVHPTVASPPKRSKPRRLRALFAGRSNDKGGAVALAAFAQVADVLGKDVDLVYVGDVPESSSVHDAVTIVPLQDRASHLAQLDAAHIFVAPTAFESYGMALVEAAAHGLALVTTRGTGMEHVEELFAERRNALFLDTEWPFERRVRAVRDAIVQLARDHELLASISEQNRELVKDGALSVARRDAALMRAYAACTTAPSSSATRPRVSFDEQWCCTALAEAVGGRYVRLRI
jgi:glycosyltransferase involved in cell wall biosynthesis